MYYHYFGGAFAISLIINVLLVLAGSFRLKKHKAIFRSGGISIILAFLVLVFFSTELEKTTQITGLLIGVFLILIFGIVDDFKDINWKKQLFFQVLLAAILIFSGYSINYITGPYQEMIRLDKLILNIGSFSLSIISSLVIIAWVVSIINAINWVDGIDGLVGTLALLSSIALVVVSLLQHVNQPAIAIISLIFAGSICGFFWFNAPPARIEAGTSGSYAIGFILASLAIIAGTKIATSMIVLAIPIVDSIWVIAERKKTGKPITKRDKRHLHYKLRSIGWSDKQIILLYGSFVSTMLFLFFISQARIIKLSIVVLEVLIILLFIGFVTKIKTKGLKKSYVT